MARLIKVCASVVIAATAGVFLIGTAVAREAGVAAAVNVDAVTTPPSERERTLVVGHNIVFDEKVVTGKRGQAQLLMMDQSAITVAPNSELVIDKFVYDPDKKTGEMALSLSRGLMRFVGGRLSKKGNVKLRTPSATMGIRGGIVIANVADDGSVTVTLLYGDGVEGTSDNGQSFSLRRHGYSTKIEPGKDASTPQPAPSTVLTQSLKKLQGRASSSAGAPERPTEKEANDKLSPTNAPTATAPPTPNEPAPRKEPDEKPEVPDDKSGDPPEVVDDDDPQDDVVVQNLIEGERLDFATVRQSGGIFQAIAAIFTVDDDDVESPNNALVAGIGGENAAIEAGVARVYTISNEDGTRTLAAQEVVIEKLDGTRSLAGPIQFAEGIDGNPDAVANIFDTEDTTLYQSAETSFANATSAFGPNLANTIAPNSHFGELFFNQDLTSPDFDGVNGSRITVTGGQAFVSAPTGQSFFALGGDTRETSLLPFSEVGKFQLPIFGVSATETRVIEAANVNDTPFIVDWDKGKALYIGGVFQNINDGNGAINTVVDDTSVTAVAGAVDAQTTSDRVYGIQAIVANVTTDNAGIPTGFTGNNVGSTHFELNDAERRRFHNGLVDGSSLGDATDNTSGKQAVILTGDHFQLDAQDAGGNRQDPTLIKNQHFAVSAGAVDVGAPGAGTTQETLFAGGMIQNADGDLERLVTDPNAEGGAGSFTIDRDGREVVAIARLHNEIGSSIALQNSAENSAFFSDKLFAVADSKDGVFLSGGDANISFVMVAGDGVLSDADNPCECAFMHWGFWAAGLNEPGKLSISLSDIGTFFAGVQTPDIDMPISGTAKFSGAAYASMTTAADSSPTFSTGSFVLDTNFQTGKSVGDMNLGKETFAVFGNHNVGSSGLSVEYRQDSLNVGTGHGAFFGSGANAAQNVGVTINIDDGNGLTAAGAAVGERQ